MNGQIPAAQDAITRRRRMAELLMQQGASTEPVQHWTQGAARVMQALSGAYMGNEADRMGKERESYEKQQQAQKQAADRAYAEAAMQREAQQRATLAQQYGLQQGTPEFQRFVLGGKVDSPQNTEAPSNVREWQYFNQLPPEQQQQYINMKRSVPYLDTGTGFVQPNVANPAGPPMATLPKDLAGAERQKAIGEAQGKAIAAAPSDVNAAEDALYLARSIREDKNLDAGTSSLSPIGNMIPKTPGYDFQTKVEQAKSGAFLSAIQQLRGMGALSNAEGQTATQAITRMNTSASKEEFLSALSDYERTVRRARDKGLTLMQQQPMPMPMPQQPPQPGAVRRRFNPATGELE